MAVIIVETIIIIMIDDDAKPTVAAGGLRGRREWEALSTKPSSAGVHYYVGASSSSRVVFSGKQLIAIPVVPVGKKLHLIRYYHTDSRLTVLTAYPVELGLKRRGG